MTIHTDTRKDTPIHGHTDKGTHINTIVHSKKLIPEVYLTFFKCFERYFQFSLFQCLKAAFVLLTFQFQVCSALGKQLSLFARKSVVFFFLFFEAKTNTPFRRPSCRAREEKRKFSPTAKNNIKGESRKRGYSKSVVLLFTHKQAFASDVRCTCTNPTCGAESDSNCTGTIQRGRQQKIRDVLL